jgi:hypothetical protein
MVQQPEFPQDRNFDKFIKSLSINELAVEAKNHPAESSKRRKVMTRLIYEIENSGKLFYQPKRDEWSADTYTGFKDEALRETWLAILKIENYKPEIASVMTWVNSNILKYKFKDVVKNYYKGISILSLDELEWDVPAEETSSDSLSLEQFLEEDPEGLLPKEHIRDYPRVTWQWLAKEKYVADHTWKEISEKTGISVQTLCSFLNRPLPRLEQYFRKYFR